MPTIGHNKSDNINADQLKNIVARIEKVEAEKAEKAECIKEIYAEAKGAGFCPKTIRHIIKMRKKDPQERQEEEDTLHLYMHAIQMDMFDDEE